MIKTLKKLTVIGLALLGLMVTQQSMATGICISNVTFTVNMSQNCTLGVVVTEPLIGNIVPYYGTRTYPLGIAGGSGDPCNGAYAHNYTVIHFMMDTACCNVNPTLVGTISYVKNGVTYTTNVIMPANTWTGFWTVYITGTGSCESAEVKTCLFYSYACPVKAPEQ